MNNLWRILRVFKANGFEMTFRDRNHLVYVNEKRKKMFTVTLHGREWEIESLGIK